MTEWQYGSAPDARMINMDRIVDKRWRSVNDECDCGVEVSVGFTSEGWVELVTRHQTWCAGLPRVVTRQAEHQP